MQRSQYNIGDKIGDFTINGNIYSNRGADRVRYYADFNCVCGNVFNACVHDVKYGKKRSCGCLNKSHRHGYKIGDKVERLIFLGDVSKNKHNMVMGEFQCFCGNKFQTTVGFVKSGQKKSCGCVVEKRKIKSHGDSYSCEYKIWGGMKNRCNNTNLLGYDSYGGRGIKVCERWASSYNNFLTDMGRRPSLGYSLDRIDVNGNYEPSNCRWATSKEQSNNRRCSVFITHEGKTLTLSQWCQELGLNRRLVDGRYKLLRMQFNPIIFSNKKLKRCQLRLSQQLSPLE